MNASFSTLAGLLVNWLADFYLAATVVLLVAFLAWRWMRQPAHRLAVAWAVMIELLALTVVCALPFWPKISFFAADTAKPAVETPPVVMREIAPRPPIHMERVLEEKSREIVPMKREIVKPTEKPAPARVPWTVKELISLGYLAGAGLVGLWLCWGAAAAAWMCRRAQSASEVLHGHLVEVVQNVDAASRRIERRKRQDAASTLGRVPRLLVSSHVASAVALGVLRPTIVLPAGLAEKASPTTLRTILRHEWCHIRNRDLWLLALGRCLLMAFFAHPLFWWLRRAVRGDQELLADAVAAGEQRQDYAEELLRLVRHSTPPGPLAVSAAMGLWEGSSQLTRRITMLLDETFRIHPTGSRRAKIGALGLMLFIGAVCSLLTLQPARSAEEQKKPPTAANSTPEKKTEPTEKNPKEENKAEGKKSLTKTGRGTLYLYRTFATATDDDMKGVIFLPGYGVLMHQKVVEELKLTDEQKRQLDEVQKNNGKEQAKYYTETAKTYQHLTPEERGKADNEHFSKERESIRKQVEAILTPDQIQQIQAIDLQEKAFQHLPSLAGQERGVLDLTKTQKDEIFALLKPMYAEQARFPHEAKRKILAVFGPEQQAKIREFMLGPEQPIMQGEVGVPLDDENHIVFVPASEPYPDFSLPQVQQKLNLTADQQKRVREILSGSEDLTDRLVKELKKLTSKDQKNLGSDAVTFNGTGGTMISGSGKTTLNSEDKKKQEEQFFENLKKEREKQRAEWEKSPLVKLSLELRGQFEALLTPEQLAKYKEQAFDSIYYAQLNDPLLLRHVGASEEQKSALNRIMKEAQENTEQLMRDMGKKLLNVLTPPQREKLGEAIEREQAEYLKTGNYSSPNDQSKTEMKAASPDKKPAKEGEEQKKPSAAAEFKDNLSVTAKPQESSGADSDVSRASGTTTSRPSDKTEDSVKPTENKLASPDQNSTFETPQLLYLSWQKDGIHSTGKPIPQTLWDLDGKILDDQLAAETLKKVGSFSVAWRKEGDLHPLDLVFKVDPRITYCPVEPIVITADGRKFHGMTAINKPTNGMNVSATAPDTHELKEWPKQISLEIKYPVENITAIKTLTDIPDHAVDIAPGVRWYLDPTRARDAGALRRAEGKTAAVLETSRELADPLVTYKVRVYLRGIAAPLSSLYSTIIEPNGKLHEIDVSEAFDGKNVIERIEITRQRCAVRRIDNVPIRVDLLPKMNPGEAAIPSTQQMEYRK